MDSPRQPVRWFAVLLLLYLAGHAIVRAQLPFSLEYDEAEQLIHVQSLEWGYFAQPPLYTWLLWPVVQVLGVSVLALLVVKFLLLGLLYTLLYAVARKFGLDGWRAFAVAFSPLLLPIFAWESVRMMTHTILL